MLLYFTTIVAMDLAHSLCFVILHRVYLQEVLRTDGVPILSDLTSKQHLTDGLPGTAVLSRSQAARYLPNPHRSLPHTNCWGQPQQGSGTYQLYSPIKPISFEAEPLTSSSKFTKPPFPIAIFAVRLDFKARQDLHFNSLRSKSVPEWAYELLTAMSNDGERCVVFTAWSHLAALAP